MSKMRIRAIHLLILFLSISFVPILLGQDYAVRLAATNRAGQKYQVSSKCSEYRINALYSDGSLLKQEAETNVWRLMATVEVVAVNDKGRATELRVSIKDFVEIDALKTNVLFTAGTEMKAVMQPKGVEFQAGGKAISPKLNGLLSSLVEVKSPSEPTDDQIWGTLDKKKMGDTWKPNLELAVQYMQQDSYKIDPKSVEAKMKLSSIVETNGVKCLQVQGQLNAPSVGVNVARGMVVRNASLNVELSGLFPVSPDKSCLQNTERAVFNMTALGKTKDGHGIQLNAEAERKMERKFTY